MVMSIMQFLVYGLLLIALPFLPAGMPVESAAAEHKAAAGTAETSLTSFRLAVFGQEAYLEGDIYFSFDVFTPPEDRESCLLGGDIDRYREAGFLAQLNIIPRGQAGSYVNFPPSDAFRQKLASLLADAPQSVQAKVSGEIAPPRDGDHLSGGDQGFVLIARLGDAADLDLNVSRAVSAEEAAFLKTFTELLRAELDREGITAGLSEDFVREEGFVSAE